MDKKKKLLEKLDVLILFLLCLYRQDLLQIMPVLFKYSLTRKLCSEISEVTFSVREVANCLGAFDSLKADGPDGVFSFPLEEFSQEMPPSF